MAYSIELPKHVLPNLHTWDPFWSDENDESKHDEADYVHRKLAEIAVKLIRDAKKASCASNSSRHSVSVEQWEPPWEPPWEMPWDQHLE
jgi:hypothetical protein